MNWQLFEANFESFVGVNLWTMLFAWANLLIVYLFLQKLLFKPIKNNRAACNAKLIGYLFE